MEAEQERSVYISGFRRPSLKIKKQLKKFLLRGLVASMPIILLVAIFSDYMKLYWASKVFEIKYRDAALTKIEEGYGSLVVRRDIHRAFSQMGVFLPLEDIVIDNEQDTDARELLLSRKTCGQGNIYLWLSSPIHLPGWGTNVVEWCKSL